MNLFTNLFSIISKNISINRNKNHERVTYEYLRINFLLFQKMEKREGINSCWKFTYVDRSNRNGNGGEAVLEGSTCSKINEPELRVTFY